MTGNNKHMKIITRILLLSLFATVTVAAQSDSAPTFQVRLAELVAPDSSAPADADTMTLTNTNPQIGRTYIQKYYVHRQVLLDQSDLESVKLVTDQPSGRPELDLTFSPRGRERFAQVTRDNTGKRLAIIINGQLYEAPVVRDEITGGKAVVTGSFTKDEAENLTRKINDAIRK